MELYCCYYYKKVVYYVFVVAVVEVEVIHFVVVVVVAAVVYTVEVADIVAVKGEVDDKVMIELIQLEHTVVVVVLVLPVINYFN
jgi:hypothetical protein